jgi:cytochrome oxidase Cu insertion factor (SCO1/SenC/PrrC family)
MSPKQYKLMMLTLWSSLALCLISLLVIGAFRGSLRGPAAGDGTAAVTMQDDLERPDSSGLPVLFEAPGFELVNQDGQKVSKSDLAGKPFVAAFMFSNCTTACPMMAGKMKGLQDRIEDKDVRMVSFTVDPERDTPEVLKGYLKRFNADTARWFFLTGSKEQMVAVERGFGVRLPRPAPDARTNEANPAPTTNPMDLLPHSDRFLLVDAEGRVRGIYDTKDDNAMAKLRTDAVILAELAR